MPKEVDDLVKELLADPDFYSENLKKHKNQQHGQYLGHNTIRRRKNLLLT
jgi:hypothetical protein